MDEQECVLCGAIGDGKEGWLADHRILCPELEVPCPCKIYGCPETMKRKEIKAHLPFCPASGVLCCYGAYAATEPGNVNKQMPEHWIFQKKPHIEMSFQNGKSQIVVNRGEQRCSTAPMRRCDMERHFAFCHADYNMLTQSCPYCPTEPKSKDAREGRKVHEYRYTDAPPASPLHPPPKMIGTRSPSRSKPNRSYSKALPILKNRQSSSSPERDICEPEVLTECDFARRIVVAKFPSAPGHCHSDHASIQTESATREADPAAESSLSAVIAKVDVVVRILGMLPPAQLPMVVCVCSQFVEAGNDPSLLSRRKLVVLNWIPIHINENGERTWRETPEWIMPNIPVPLISWQLSPEGPCIGEHMRCCSARPLRQRSHDELLATSRILRQMTCPRGDTWLWKEEPTESTEEADSTNSQQEEAQPEPDSPELPSDADKATAVSRLFKAVMAEDLRELELLLKQGMDLNAKNSVGYSPLGLATERGKSQVEAWLRSHGAIPAVPA